MRNKSCGNGSKICVLFRNAMRNGIAIENPNVNIYIYISIAIYNIYIYPKMREVTPVNILGIKIQL